MATNTDTLSSQCDFFVLPPDLRSRVGEILGSDEQIVWVGRPIVWRHWFRSLLRAITSAGALVLFLWFAGASQLLEDDPVPFGAFLVVGVFIFTLPFGLPLLFNRQKLYLVTTKRVIIVGPKWFGVDLSRSYHSHELHGMYCRRVFAGVGDLILEQVSSTSAQSHRGFHAIRNPHEVQRLIEATLLGESPHGRDGFSRPRILCSPISSESASFRSSEAKRTVDDVLWVGPTSGARLFGIACFSSE
jgi:hypothetical protein